MKGFLNRYIARAGTFLTRCLRRQNLATTGIPSPTLPPAPSLGLKNPQDLATQLLDGNIDPAVRILRDWLRQETK